MSARAAIRECYVAANAARWGAGIFVGARARHGAPELARTAFVANHAPSGGHAAFWLAGLSRHSSSAFEQGPGGHAHPHAPVEYDLAREARAAGCFARATLGGDLLDIGAHISTEALSVALSVETGGASAPGDDGSTGVDSVPSTSVVVIAEAPVREPARGAGASPATAATDASSSSDAGDALVIHARVRIHLLDAYGARKPAPASARCHIGVYERDSVGLHSGATGCALASDGAAFAAPGWAYASGEAPVHTVPATAEATHVVLAGGDIYPATFTQPLGANGSAAILGGGALLIGGWALGASLPFGVSCYEEATLSACKWGRPGLYARRGCCFRCAASQGACAELEVSQSLPPARLEVQIPPRCPPGSAPAHGGCTACAAGTYSWHGEECLPCPGTYEDGVLCPGGQNLVHTRGYWRASDLSAHVVRCPLRAACRGCNASVPCSADDAVLLARRPCEDGYEGPVCGICAAGYYRASGACLRCPGSAGARRLFVAAVVLGVLGASGVCFVLPLTPTPGEGYPTVKLKILLSLLQVAAQLAAYDVPWPANVLRSLEAFTVANLDIEVARPGCLRDDGSTERGSIFLSMYRTTMALPVGVVLPLLAVVALNRRRARGRAREAPELQSTHDDRELEYPVHGRVLEQPLPQEGACAHAPGPNCDLGELPACKDTEQRATVACAGVELSERARERALKMRAGMRALYLSMAPTADGERVTEPDESMSGHEHANSEARAQPAAITVSVSVPRAMPSGDNAPTPYASTQAQAKQTSPTEHCPTRAKAETLAAEGDPSDPVNVAVESECTSMHAFGSSENEAGSSGCASEGGGAGSDSRGSGSDSGDDQLTRNSADGDAPCCSEDASLPPTEPLSDLEVRCWRLAFQAISMLYMTTCRRALMLYSYHTLEVGTFLRADYSVMVAAAEATAGTLAAEALNRGTAGAPSLPALDAIRTAPEQYAPYFAAGFVILPFYAFGIPALFAGVLYYHRHELDALHVQQRYGFLIQGYHLEGGSQYWEVVEMLRKLLMATLAVVPMTGTMQCFAGELLTIVFLTVHALRQPFVTRMDNNLQTCALALVGLYLLIGLVQCSQNSEGTLTARSMGMVMLITIGSFMALLATIVFHLVRHKLVRGVASAATAVSRRVRDVTKRVSLGALGAAAGRGGRALLPRWRSAAHAAAAGAAPAGAPPEVAATTVAAPAHRL